jgi:uncharacterized protein YehS (DUF1456 family)
MDNNDILRRLRYAFELSDSTMIGLFALAEKEVTRAEISNWLKKEEDPDWAQLYDRELATFLSGMIVHKRGQKEGEPLKIEKSLNNNTILRKLRIALNLTDDDMLGILELANVRISKHELSAFFRKPEHGNYKPCGDQILRNFIVGLQVAYREP